MFPRCSLSVLSATLLFLSAAYPLAASSAEPSADDVLSSVGIRRGGPAPWLCLVTGWPLLKRPHVAVGVTEI